MCKTCVMATRSLRATVLQQKTQRHVQFELTAPTRESVENWIKARRLEPTDFLFPSRLHSSPHLSTRQYSRIVHRWVASIGLDRTAYGTHSMRRTKVSLISFTIHYSLLRGFHAPGRSSPAEAGRASGDRCSRIRRKPKSSSRQLEPSRRLAVRHSLPQWQRPGCWIQQIPQPAPQPAPPTRRHCRQRL